MKLYKNILLIGLAVLLNLPSILFADSIVSFADLHFHSNFEKAEFTKLKNNAKPDYFALFLSADKKISPDDYNRFKNRVASITTSFQKKSFKKLKEKKKVSKVYSQVQEQLMDKYVETAVFSDLFQKGEYQCVTSSMLFTRVFDQLNIPYEIDFEPGHVYLVAYPESAKVMVQTTNPNKGVFVYDNGFKNNFIQYLRKNKLISKDEYENKSIDKLFTEYYLKTEVSSLKGLAAMQYSNLAILKLQENEIQKSFQYMLKAYYLDSNTQNRFLLALTLGLTMDQASAADEHYANYVVMLYKLTENNLNKELFLSVFDMITDKQLDTKGDIDLYNKSYRLINNNINDSTLISEISFKYNWALSIKYLNQSNPEKAYPFVLKALALQPENAKAQTLLLELLGQKAGAMYSNVQQFSALHDSAMVMYDNYPTLQTNDLFVNLMYRMELRLTGFYFYRGNSAKGLRYKKQFETLVSQSGIEPNFKTKNLVERNYSSISVYYFKHNNMAKAKAAITSALKYYPDSFNLRERLKSFN